METVEIDIKNVGNYASKKQENTPLVSIVVPAYNEEAIVEENLSTICEYMASIEDDYSWELVFVNDGSTDKTGDKAHIFAKNRNNILVLNHFTNFNLGQALRYAFKNCRGKYIVTMDLDLSYSPDHIKKLVDAIRQTRAKIIVASPYMKGGKTTDIPWIRKIMSIWANRLLSLTAKSKISTITGMVRAYDRKFINTINTKAMDMAINPEIIYKSELLRARILEIPAHLDWSSQKKVGKARRSSMNILWNIASSLFSAFIFRPFMFFILPGAGLMLISLYPISWALIHTLNQLQNPSYSGLAFDHRFSAAIAEAFRISPHSFVVGGVSLMIAIQLLSLGILALQNKRYFEELFHLGSTKFKDNREDDEF
jgi:glycosyltransferase involved in cell wall biosynthesis